MTKASRNVELFYFIHGFSTIFYQQFFQFVMDFSLLTFGELLYPLNNDLKNQIKNFEKQKKQIYQLNMAYILIKHV